MSKLLLLIIPILIILTSCDGRDRAYKSNQKILQENKLLDSFSEVVKYFPEHYTEVKTDTVLSNGISVNIKFYSDMENSLLHKFKIDTIQHKHHYRNFLANISASKNGQEFFNISLNKIDFILDVEQNKDFILNESILQFIRLDELSSLNNNKPTILIDFCKPETDHCLAYKMIINDDGTYKIESTDNLYFQEI